MGRRRVDLQTAAGMLGVSSDAVRKRAKRGTIPSETGADGKLYVWVYAGESGGKDPALVEALRDQINHLRDQLDKEREANRENRRLLAAALERIPPQLEPPRDGPQTGGDSAGGVSHPATEGAQEGTERSWWRRWFGFE